MPERPERLTKNESRLNARTEDLVAPRRGFAAVNRPPRKVEHVRAVTEFLNPLPVSSSIPRSMTDMTR